MPFFTLRCADSSGQKTEVRKTHMNYKYEMACKEAGMREEDIQALRREFDNDYKRLSRENEKNEKKERMGYASVSLSIITSDGDDFDVEIEDPRTNIEEDFIHNWELQRLGELMAELDPVDKEFLYDYI